MSLQTIVDRIFAHLKQCGLPVAGRRQPGADSVAIKAKIRLLGLQAPDDLVNLYSLCDGTATKEGELLGTIQFFPGFFWMGIDEAITVYHFVNSNEQWSRGWFPIFGNGGGDFYVVDCDPCSPYFGEVVGFVIGENEQITEFQNVTTLFETIERSFAQKAFRMVNGNLTADYPRMRAIAHCVQPNFVEHVA